MTVTWDPAQYGKFAEQRMRPVADLLARITLDAPEAIYDLGCGDGRVTRLLADRWPDRRDHRRRLLTRDAGGGAQGFARCEMAEYELG